MAKFISKKPDLIVSTDDGYIKFLNGRYVTTKKKEIEILQNIQDVKEETPTKATTKES